jgi:hypothetical protein
MFTLVILFYFLVFFPLTLQLEKEIGLGYVMDNSSN